MRQLYEYVIIDTPPVLPASESLLMSSAADSTILCVRRDFSRIDQMIEASKRLRSSGIHLAGAVLSGVPAHQYARRYGASNYSHVRGRSHSGALEPTNIEAS
jgi:Mrp family chromosome partitioning ATPase